MNKSSFIIIILISSLIIACGPRSENKFPSHDRNNKNTSLLEDDYQEEIYEDDLITNLDNSYSDKSEDYHEEIYENDLITNLDNSYSDESKEEAKSNIKSYNLQGYGDFSKSSALLLENAYNITTSASFIYWQHSQASGMYLGATRNVINSGGADFSVQFDYFKKEFSPKFEPGFKVGLGYVLDNDKWDIFGEYTFYRAKERISWTDNIGNQSSIRVAVNDSSNVNDVSGKHKLDLDKFTLEFGRSGWFGKSLSIRPFLGTNLYFTKQNYVFSYLTQESGRNDFLTGNTIKSSSWALGGRGGLDSKFILGYGFNFEGKIALSLLYEKNRYKLNNMRDADTVLYKVREGYVHSAVPLNTEFILGFSWNKYFANNRSHCNISLMYEFQRIEDFDYANAILSGIITSYLVNPDTLYLHGPVATVKFDF